jgi:hypothetical protein
MIKYLVILLFAVSLGCNSPSNKNTSKKGVVFEEYFKKVKQINLSPRIRLGEIGQIDIDNKNRILVTDRSVRQVAIFDSLGNLLKELSPEACNPGFNWNPISAKFNPRNGILVLMNGPYGFWFDNNGLCIGKTLPGFNSAHRNFVFDNHGKIYATSNDFDGTYIGKYDSTALLVGKTKLETNYSGLNSRFSTSTILYDKKMGLMSVLPFELNVFQYGLDISANIKPLRVIGISSGYFRSPSQDIKDGGQGLETSVVAQKMMKILKESSSVINIFKLDGDIICLIIRNGYANKTEREIGIVVSDLNGRSLTQKEIQTDRRGWFFYGKGKYLYRVIPPEKNPKCDSCGIPNEGLEVYELNISK